MLSSIIKVNSTVGCSPAGIPGSPTSRPQRSLGAADAIAALSRQPAHGAAAVQVQFVTLADETWARGVATAPA